MEAEFRFVVLCSAARFGGAACFLSCAGLLLFGADAFDVFAANGFALDIFVAAGFALDGFASDAGLPSGFGVAASPLEVSAVSLPETISSTTWLS